MCVGICNKNAISKFKYGFNSEKIGHGAYMID
jgi:hypothetical protein